MACVIFKAADLWSGVERRYYVHYKQGFAHTKDTLRQIFLRKTEMTHIKYIIIKECKCYASSIVSFSASFIVKDYCSSDQYSDKIVSCLGQH